jgi:chromosome segregation ATPase
VAAAAQEQQVQAAVRAEGSMRGRLEAAEREGEELRGQLAALEAEKQGLLAMVEAKHDRVAELQLQVEAEHSKHAGLQLRVERAQQAAESSRPAAAPHSANMQQGAAAVAEAKRLQGDVAMTSKHQAGRQRAAGEDARWDARLGERTAMCKELLAGTHKEIAALTARLLASEQQCRRLEGEVAHVRLELQVRGWCSCGAAVVTL